MDTILIAMIVYNCTFSSLCSECIGSAYNFDTSSLLKSQCCCPATKEDESVLKTYGSKKRTLENK